MNTKKKTQFLLWLALALPLLSHAEGLLAVDNPAKNGQGNKVYVATEAFAGNDQLAMRQYGGDWLGNYSPRSGTNIGLLGARAETGVQWQGYRLGVLYRAEALVEANRDTSDLVQQYNSKNGYDLGRVYQLDYQIKGFEANGARLSKSFQINLASRWQMDFGFGASYLRGTRIKLATASGQITTINAKEFDAHVSMNDTHSQIDVTDRLQFSEFLDRRAAPSGQGYALDVGVVLRHLESGSSIELAVADLAGRMDWKNIPNNLANYNNANTYLDTDGYRQFKQTVAGTSSYQNLSQTLDPKLWLAANYPVGDFEFQGATSYTRGYWFPQAGVKYRINPQWGVNADFDFRFSTLGVGVQHQWFYLALRMDSMNLEAAKAYGLRGGVNIPF